MAHPVYVTVTGALFYDDAHEYMPDGSTGRGGCSNRDGTLAERRELRKSVNQGEQR